MWHLRFPLLTQHKVTTFHPADLTYDDSSIVAGCEEDGHEQAADDETDVVGHRATGEARHEEQTQRNQHHDPPPKPVGKCNKTFNLLAQSQGQEIKAIISMLKKLDEVLKVFFNGGTCNKNGPHFQPEIAKM